jgi:hypothetical protein
VFPKINGLTTHVDVAKQDYLFKENTIHSMIYKLKEKDICGQHHWEPFQGMVKLLTFMGPFF